MHLQTPAADPEPHTPKVEASMLPENYGRQTGLVASSLFHRKNPAVGAWMLYLNDRWASFNVFKRYV